MALPATRCRRSVAALLMACALVAASTSALPAQSDKDNLTGVEKTRRALNQTLDMEFANTTLKAAIANLREQTKLNIVLYEQSGNSEAPVTISLHKVKLRLGLQALFGQYELGYAILGDVLLIAHKEEAVNQQMQQLVNVDLDNVLLSAALKKLGRETATNLAIDPRVGKDAQTPLSMQLEEVPLEMAVRTMAEAANLKPVRIGNVLFVTTEVRANQLQADPDTKSLWALRKLLEDANYMLVPGDQGGARFVPRTMPGFGLGMGAVGFPGMLQPRQGLGLCGALGVGGGGIGGLGIPAWQQPAADGAEGQAKPVAVPAQKQDK